MNPFEIVLWALAGGVALVLAALAIGLVIMIIRSAVSTPIGKSKGEA